MSRKAMGWLAVAIAMFAPLAATAQEGETYTIQSVQDTNDVLKAQWMDLRVEQVEVLTVGRAHASTRLHRQPFRWVAGDSRRAADGNRLTYLVDLANGPGGGEVSGSFEAAVDRSMAQWAGAPCLSAEITKRSDTGEDVDLFDSHFGYGASGNWRAADVVFAGWLPTGFFDAVTGDGANILALSVTFIFVGPDGQPTDIDGDGYLDTAANEIYFNDGFSWMAGGMDVETVALHEIGHALGIGHIGPPPLAAMNPVYAGSHPELMPLDEAALCTIWSSWPH